jgi:SMODS and SLOG-associating 2TM effector domain 3/SMODS and SLOG-associating 2TM effector domain 1
MSSVYVLQDNDLPPLFRQADALSIRMQHRFFGMLAAELVFLTLGALVGVFSSSRIQNGHLILGESTAPFFSATYLIAGTLILAALVIRLYRFVGHADARWYATRAVAESAKSLAWRYAVGGQPFNLGLDTEAADTLLLHRLSDTLADVPRLARALNAVAKDKANPTSGTMNELRKQDLDIRIESYRTGRVDDQLRWYERKARDNHRLAHRTHWILALLEAIGVVFILLQLALSASIGASFPLEGFIAVLVTAGIAWSQAKRYQDLSISYHVASREAYSLENGIPKEPSEATWAAFVDDAESAFSREHRLWRATRTI